MRDQDLITALYNWQTLATGMLALISAGIGALFINKQIAEARNSEKIHYERRHRAARATLPLSLSKFNSYARETAKELKALHQCDIQGEIPLAAPRPKFPHIPDDVIAQLSTFIEVSDYWPSTVVAKLLTRLQVQYARIRDLDRWFENPGDEIQLTINIETYIIDVAEIYARTSALFDFARGKTDSVATVLGAAEVLSALQQLGFWEARFEQLKNDAAKRSY